MIPFKSIKGTVHLVQSSKHMFLLHVQVVLFILHLDIFVVSGRVLEILVKYI